MILRCVYIDAADPQFLRLDTRYEAGFLDAAALQRYAGRPEYDLPESFVHRALASNDDCFAIRDGDELAAYGWYSTGANHFTDGLTLRFDRHWVYMYRGFTNPAYRGQRLHAVGMTMALNAYLARGFRGLVSCVEARNEASLKSVYRMGYRSFGSIYGLRRGRLVGIRSTRGFWGQELTYCSPGCRRFGFRLEPPHRSGASTAAARPLKV